MQSNGKPTGNSPTEKFLQLFIVHQKRIYTSILMWVPRTADADDLLQETAAVMWNKFEEFEEGTNFAAWAISIARYRVLSFRKKQRKKEIQFSAEMLDIIASRVVPMLDTMEERLEALENCLTKLNGNDRDLIQMRYEQDTSVKEIAKRVNRPVQGLYKAMARIQNLLLECVRRTLATEDMA